MPDPVVFHVPVELGLELMAPIYANRVNAEWKLPNHVVDEVDGTLLVVALVDPQRSDPRGIIDRCVLETTDQMAIGGPWPEELDIHLDVVTRYLLGVSTCVNGATSDILRQPPEVVADKSTIDGRAGRLDAVIPRQVPCDPFRAEMIVKTQVDDLLNHVGRQLTWMTPRHRLLTKEPRLFLRSEELSPSVEC